MTRCPVSSIAVVLSALALGSIPAPALAGDAPLEVTLSEALVRALDHNPGYASAREAVSIAKGHHLQARSGLLPQLSATGYKTWQSDPGISFGGISPVFGGSLFPSQITDRRLTLGQTIVNLQSLWSSRSAKKQVRAAASDIEKARIDLVSGVKQAFFDLIFSNRMVEVMRATLDQSLRQLRQAQQNVAAGVSSKLELLRADVSVANVRQQLIEVTAAQEIAEQVLANSLGLESTTRVVPVGEFVPFEKIPKERELIENAMAHRPDVRAATIRYLASKDAVRGAKSGYLPTVQLLAQRDRSLGQRFPLDREIEIDSATVQVNFPLFDGQLARGKVQESRGQERRAAADLLALERNVELDVTRAVSLITNARAALKTSETAVRQAQEALDISNEGYRLGVRTYLEVMDAQLALTVARSNRLKAEKEYSTARARLDQAQGLATGVESMGEPRAPADRNPTPRRASQ
jgi:outer membrane protein TolC